MKSGFLFLVLILILIISSVLLNSIISNTDFKKFSNFASAKKGSGKGNGDPIPLPPPPPPPPPPEDG